MNGAFLNCFDVSYLKTFPFSENYNCEKPVHGTYPWQYSLSGFNHNTRCISCLLVVCEACKGPASVTLNQPRFPSPVVIARRCVNGWTVRHLSAIQSGLYYCVDWLFADLIHRFRIIRSTRSGWLHAVQWARMRHCSLCEANCWSIDRSGGWGGAAVAVFTRPHSPFPFPSGGDDSDEADGPWSLDVFGCSYIAPRVLRVLHDIRNIQSERRSLGARYSSRCSNPVWLMSNVSHFVRSRNALFHRI